MVESSGQKMFSQRRKHLRLRTKSLHNVHLEILGGGYYVQLVNISLGGVGFLANSNQPIQINSEIKAVLSVDQAKVEADLRVVRNDGQMVGCSFINPSHELQTHIENYFNVELAALKMTQVETKADGQLDGKMIYFRGHNSCELLVYDRHGTGDQFSIILFGNYIEGDRVHGLTVGERVQDVKNKSRGVSFFKTLSDPERHTIESAIRFVDGVEGLGADRSEAIIGMINKFYSGSKSSIKKK